MKIIFKDCGFRIDTRIFHASTFGISDYNRTKKNYWPVLSCNTHSDMRSLIGLIN